MTEYIEILGIKYPVIINFYVIGEFQKETGQSFSDFSMLQNKLYFVEPLLFHSIRVGQILTKSSDRIKREDMPILLSENKVYEDFLNLITKFFPTENTPDEDKKK